MSIVRKNISERCIKAPKKSRLSIFRRVLLEPLENRQLMAGDMFVAANNPTPSKTPDAIVRHLPAESAQYDSATIDYLANPQSPTGRPILQGTVTQDDIYNSQSSTDWGGTINPIIEATSEVLAMAIEATRPSTSLDPNIPVRAKTDAAHDLVYGGNKNDVLKLDHHRSQAVGGKGDDELQLNAPNVIAFGNQGKDVIVFNSSSGTAFGGPGTDTYHISPTTQNNEIYDASPISEVVYPGKLAELEIQLQSGSDVVLSKDGQPVVTLKAIDLNTQEIVLHTSDSKVGLSVYSKVPDRDAVLASIASYEKRRAEMEPKVEELGYAPPSRTVDAKTGTEISVWERKFAPALTGDVTTDLVPVNGQYVIGIAGTQDARDFAVFAVAPNLQARTVIQTGQKLISENHATIITVTGHSGGGEVGLRAARQLAIDNTDVQINVVMINSGGVAALSADTYDLPNLNITHLRSEADILSNSATNVARGIVTKGQPLVYPSNTETLTVPYDNSSGPDFKTEPLKWIDYHHEAERVLDYLENDINTKRMFKSNSTDNSPFTMPIKFEDLALETQSSIITATKALVSMDTTLPTIPSLEMNFDFGAKNYVAEGTIPISADTKYSPSVGYGLIDTAQVRNGDDAMGDDWQRDFVTAKSIPFRIDLPKGSYDVTLQTGNEAGLEYLTVLANSSTISTIYNTAPKEIKETTLRVQHPGGAMQLEVRDTGGLSKNAVLNGLTIKRVAPWTPLPQVAVTDPSLTVIVPGYVEAVSVFDRIAASIKPVKEIVVTVGAILSPAAPLTAFQIVSSIHTLAQSTAKLVKTWSNETPEDPNWTIKAQIASNHQNALRGLPIQRLAYSGTLLTTLESMTNEQQQKLLKHSDVIIINAQKQLNDGVKPYGAFGDKVSDAKAYRKSIDRVTDQIFRAVANKVRAIGLADSAQQLDLQIIAEDFATVAAREAIGRIAQEDGMLAAELGYVELVALNPISVEQTDKLYVNHPELRPFQFWVHNFWEDITDVPNGFVKGPLDKEEGGNYLGVEAGIVREFSGGDELGSVRYKNFNNENKPVQGEVAKTSHHDNGLVAFVNTNGYLSIIDTKADKRVFQDRIVKSKPTDLKFSPDGKNLAILNEKGTLIVLNMATKTLKSLRIESGYDVGLQWIDQNRIILAGSGGAIQWVTVSPSGQIGTLSPLGRIADNVVDFWLDPAPANQQPRLVSVHKDRTIQVWNLDNKLQPNFAFRALLKAKQQVLDIDTVRGNILLSDGTVVELVQISNNRLVTKLTLADTAKDANTTAGRFTNDGKLFITGGDDQQLRVYDLTAALIGKRSLVKTYKSIMPEVRAIDVSHNGDRLWVSYKDEKGGKTLDRNIADAVSERIPFLGKLFGDEFTKAKLLPSVVFEDYPDKLRFHARRDRADLGALYGQSAKQNGWKNALPNAVDEVFADDKPLIGDESDNLLPPKFERTIKDTSIQKTLIIDLKQIAVDPEGGSVFYSTKSSNPALVTATVTGEQLILSPVSEGSTTVTLIASDGLLSTPITFRITADGSQVRNDFAAVRAKLDATKSAQKQLQKSNDADAEDLKSLKKSVEKSETDMSEHKQRDTRLASDLASASATAQSTRATLTTATRDRDAANNELQNVKRSVETAQRNADVASAQLRAARDVEDTRQRAFNTAKKRFDDAKPAQRAARRAEMNAAKAALDSATAARVVKQDGFQSASKVLNQWIEKRKTASNRFDELATRVQKLDKALKDALVVESRAKQALDQHRAQRTALLIARDQLLVRLEKGRAIANANAKTAAQLGADLQSMVGKLQAIRAEKWVKNLGLDAWEKDSLQPARKTQESLTASINTNVQVYLNLGERLKKL